MYTDFKKQVRNSLARNAMTGLIVSIGFLAGACAWAMSASVSGAVIASGYLSVDGKAKKVQHVQGGIVADILVKEGDFVSAGDIVARLDTTVIKASLSTAKETLNQLYAERARLETELSGAKEIAISEELSARLQPKALAQTMKEERQLFSDRRYEREGVKARLSEQVKQLRLQIEGLQQQLSAKKEELLLVDEDGKVQRQLLDKFLTQASTARQVDRDAIGMRGEIGSLHAKVAEVSGQIAERELLLLQVDKNMRSEDSAKLKDLRIKEAELLEKEIVAQEALRRSDIRAPVSGIIHKLEIHTKGAVVTPAEVLMEIVPEKRSLVIDTRIKPADIDQLHVGQSARLRFTAFNRNTTPEFKGKLLRVSADLEIDEIDGTPFYRGTVILTDGEVSRAKDLTLMPGMPAEVFIETETRSIASWFVKPILDHSAHVFREE